MFLKLISTLVVYLFMVCGLQSQTQPASSPTANQVIGEFTAINVASGQISNRTDKGEAIAVSTVRGTSFRKVPAGAQSMAAAVKTDFAVVSVGDRVLAAGQRSADRSKINARAVVVMSRSELDEKSHAEQQDWRKRGMSGTVVAVNPEEKRFTFRRAPGRSPSNLVRTHSSTGTLPTRCGLPMRVLVRSPRSSRMTRCACSGIGAPTACPMRRSV
jgi:hypothetical protein